MNSRDGPLLGAVCWSILKADPPFGGWMLINSRGGPSSGCTVCLWILWGLYIDEIWKVDPHLERGSASRDNFYGSGVFWKVLSKCGKTFPLISLKVVQETKISIWNLPVTFLYDEPNLHWKLEQQTPSVGTLLAYLETKAWIIFLLWIKLFIFQASVLKKNFVKPHKINQATDTKYAKKFY